jgi:hypothetical protein
MLIPPPGSSNSAGSAAAVSLTTASRDWRNPPYGQILKMKKFPMFAPHPRDNVALSEAIKVLHRRRVGCAIQ